MATLSLASILAEAARRRPGHTALVEGERRIAFAELWRQARAQAGALGGLGIGPGDRVALMCPNTAEFPRAYYAILAAGAVVVPVHLLLTAAEAAQVLTTAGVRLMLCHAGRADIGTHAAEKAGIPMYTIGTEAEIPGAAGRLENLAEVATPIPTLVQRSADDPAVIFFTSGTTSGPKAAVLSHLNLVMNATVNAFDANNLRPDDVALGALPLFHTFGQSVSMNSTWRVGATLVLQPRFDAAAAIELMLAEGVTIFHGVPTMYVGLINAARAATRLPALKFAISGGAALPASVLREFDQAFGTQIYEGYGLSETSPTATVNQPVFGARPGTVGHPLWGVEVEIADPDLQDRVEPLPTGSTGEIVIRGHNVFSGYLDQPEATAAVLVDGWFRTGDLGTRDKDGFVTIAGRIKDLIIRSGFNVYPEEIEEVLLRCPGVAQAAVIGVPDRVHGEEVCAVLVRDGTVAPRPSADDVIDFARRHLARHKYPRRIEFVDELPLGPSQKVLKRELRARFGIA
jgi:long-chain acyl-CoA synthetase